MFEGVQQSLRIIRADLNHLCATGNAGAELARYFRFEQRTDYCFCRGDRAILAGLPLSVFLLSRFLNHSHNVLACGLSNTHCLVC
ncbi:hypothetical protein A9C11_33375 (plasmid) [Pseudomonas citronellolis]|uniref:Uncharacterized protein n=1 Tax=Pseudomonas citronellolis TaxID=53408 RepID=A0A1A9KMC3_9PSED|nr:hypothetical protein A9C11_33375 [Pseudomonas citronellolis]KWR86519.1 hypothetical protein RN02_00660 [Pseudomonas sp. PI1]